MLWDTNFFCLVCALLHTASTSHAWYFLLFCGGQLHVILIYSHCGLWTSCSTGLSQLLYLYGSKIAPKLKLCVERHIKRIHWGWDVSFVCVTYCWESLTFWKWFSEHLLFCSVLEIAIIFGCGLVEEAKYINQKFYYTLVKQVHSFKTDFYLNMLIFLIWRDTYTS